MYSSSFFEEIISCPCLTLGFCKDSFNLSLIISRWLPLQGLHLITLSILVGFKVVGHLDLISYSVFSYPYSYLTIVNMRMIPTSPSPLQNSMILTTSNCLHLGKVHSFPRLLKVLKVPWIQLVSNRADYFSREKKTPITLLLSLNLTTPSIALA